MIPIFCGFRFILCRFSAYVIVCCYHPWGFGCCFTGWLVWLCSLRLCSSSGYLFLLWLYHHCVSSLFMIFSSWLGAIFGSDYLLSGVVLLWIDGHSIQFLSFGCYLCYCMMSVSSFEMKGILDVLVDWGLLDLGGIMAVLFLFLGCDKLDWSLQLCCCSFLEFVLHISLGWNLLLGSVKLFCNTMCGWCGSLELYFYANDHFYWLLLSFINRLYFQEVDLCVFYSSGNIYYITFCPFNFLFYYFHFSCWKVFFFVGGGIEVLGAGSTPFYEGLTVFSTLISLLFWARSPCRPSMLLGYSVFLCSSGTSARKTLFLVLIVARQSISELKIP